MNNGPKLSTFARFLGSGESIVKTLSDKDNFPLSDIKFLIKIPDFDDSNLFNSTQSRLKFMAFDETTINKPKVYKLW